ncbi:MAG: hypothetical protein RMZ41_008760 [Nostoc sp. DedVER02]|uniref:hypothetical protein n=1 Tax=unclassified Nostoc TaxID=2593658 RepID=UPI002AD391E0|nr:MULTISPECIES: hypothetical protein [unclassified Nostoc]MDZ7990390.1 hypothetical protein [Nostoc sp. DedVER02]MDZ8115918.1 hypothetical protein [Nostoc sp. DedVER01b]
MGSEHLGFESVSKYPLLDAIFHRRSRRISSGLPSINAGSLSHSPRPPFDRVQPLSELEEALLIAATGATGITFPDRPFEDAPAPKGKPILGTPNLNFKGRAAGSTDNSQPTYFLLLNDTGTYFLKHLDPEPENTLFSPESLILRAKAAKVKISDERIFSSEKYRRFPFYLDSNRFLSNVPGSTVLLPIVDLSRQYINALMYVLTEDPLARPTFVDDRNFYQPAGVKKWIKDPSDIKEDEFALNKNLKLPLGKLGNMRTEYESYFLLQNLALCLQAMGLGGWIHASIGPPYLLGDPFASPETQGVLNVRWEIPQRTLLQQFTVDLLRWATPKPAMRANPCGLLRPGVDPKSATEDDWLIKCLCPPNYTVEEAVDTIVKEKHELYSDRTLFSHIFRDGKENTYIREVPPYRPEVIECAKDICRYLMKTHGRLPAHADGLFVPGIWLQAHHLDLSYYDDLFASGVGYTNTQREHQAHWHDEPHQ